VKNVKRNSCGAKESFHKMIRHETLNPGVDRKRVGALLDVLTPKEREYLKDLRSEDINDRMN